MGRSSARGASYKNSRQSRRNIINNQGYSGRYNYSKMLDKKAKNQKRRRVREGRQRMESLLIVIAFVLFIAGLCYVNTL